MGFLTRSRWQLTDKHTLWTELPVGSSSGVMGLWKEQTDRRKRFVFALKNIDRLSIGCLTSWPLVMEYTQCDSPASLNGFFNASACWRLLGHSHIFSLTTCWLCYWLEHHISYTLGWLTTSRFSQIKKIKLTRHCG